MTHEQRIKSRFAHAMYERFGTLTAKPDDRVKIYRSLLVLEMQRVDRLRLEVERWRKKALERTSP
jgi:hypothetical protein